MPIKGLTDRPPRLPRIGKIHLGVKVKQEGKAEYPRATEYFVFEPEHPQYAELVETYGEKPNELRILLPIEDETKFASQFYRLYSRTRGLVCKGDGDEAVRMVDTETGAVANRNTKSVANKTIPCQGRECPEYGPRACGEVMNLQFLLPEVSGFGVWQIDTGSINSIININSALELVRSVYGRVSMVPLILALEPREVVNPDDGKKKTVRVLNIRSQDKMIEAYRKAQMPPLQLIQAMTENGEIGDIEAEDLPPAGDEPIHGDLPVISEVGPGTETDLWPEDTPPQTESEVKPEPSGVKTTILPTPRSTLPKDAKDGDIVVVKTTGDKYVWNAEKTNWQHKGKVVLTPPEPVAETPPGKQPEVAGKAEDALLCEGMSFNDLLTYVKEHKKTEGWLFKSFSFNVDKAKERPYDCAKEVKQMMGW